MIVVGGEETADVRKPVFFGAESRAVGVGEDLTGNGLDGSVGESLLAQLDDAMMLRRKNTKARSVSWCLRAFVVIELFRLAGVSRSHGFGFRFGLSVLRT